MSPIPQPTRQSMHSIHSAVASKAHVVLQLADFNLFMLALIERLSEFINLSQTTPN